MNHLEAENQYQAVLTELGVRIWVILNLYPEIGFS
jgi:hypothetical protein